MLTLYINMILYGIVDFTTKLPHNKFILSYLKLTSKLRQSALHSPRWDSTLLNYNPATVRSEPPVLGFEVEVLDPRPHGHGRVLVAEEAPEQHDPRAAGARAERREHAGEVGPLEHRRRPTQHGGLPCYVRGGLRDISVGVTLSL